MTTTTLRLPTRIARLPQLRQIVRGGLAARGSIGAGLAATTSATGVVATSGMILHYDAANPASYPGSGTTIYDLAGAGAPNGTLNSSAPYLASGSPAAFKMEANYTVNIVENAVLRPSAITLEFWGYLVSDAKTAPPWGSPMTVGSSLICMACNDPYYVYRLGHNSGNNNFARFTVRVGSPVFGINVEVLVKPEWVHLVGTYDGETMILYRNGSEAGRNETPSGNLNYTTATQWNIGTWQDNTQSSAYSETNAYGNKWSIVRMYNRALTAAEVLGNFRAQRSRFSI